MNKTLKILISIIVGLLPIIFGGLNLTSILFSLFTTFILVFSAIWSSKPEGIPIDKLKDALNNKKKDSL